MTLPVLKRRLVILYIFQQKLIFNEPIDCIYDRCLYAERPVATYHTNKGNT